MSVETVWHATTTEANKQNRADNAKVRVSVAKPDTDDPILFEIRAPETALEPTDVEGEFLFPWGEIDNFPHSVSYR